MGNGNAPLMYAQSPLFCGFLIVYIGRVFALLHGEPFQILGLDKATTTYATRGLTPR